MSDVQIQISNIGNTDSEVQLTHAGGSIKTTIYRDKPQWFPVKAASNITVKYDNTSSQVTVDIIDGASSPVPSIQGPEVTLKIYGGQSACIEAKTSMVLKLHVIEDSTVNESRDVNAKEDPDTPYQGVKCGEVIIIPPQ